MGNAESAIRWNSVPYAETTQFRVEPAWTYYSQVSIAAPHGRVVGRIGSDVHAMQGSLPVALMEPRLTGESFLTEGSDGGASAVLPRKGVDKQAGPWSLTQRELEVLQLLAEGTTNSEISERLFISTKTTKNHLAAIFQKLDVTNRTQALVRAVVMGLVTIE